MKPDVKRKLLKALRSGKYKQGRGFLKKNGRYCCLGVLCGVVGIRPVAVGNGFWEYDGFSGGLPPVVQRLSGIRTGTGALRRIVVFKGKPYRSLMHLNDAGAKFPFIADVVKKQL